MSISSFESLLREAARQPQPQRLLFVFAEKGTPAAGDKVAANPEADAGGTLTPIMCVDKAPDALGDFAALVQESEAMGRHWDIVLVACLSGSGGALPDAAAIDQGLEMMVDTLQSGGKLSRFLAFDRAGEPLRFV